MQVLVTHAPSKLTSKKVTLVDFANCPQNCFCDMSMWISNAQARKKLTANFRGLAFSGYIWRHTLRTSFFPNAPAHTHKHTHTHLKHHKNQEGDVLSVPLRTSKNTSLRTSTRQHIKHAFWQGETWSDVLSVFPAIVLVLWAQGTASGLQSQSLELELGDPLAGTAKSPQH